jgi:hypothetical protein
MVCADIEAMVKERRSGRVKRATVGLARWRRLTKCAGPIRRVEARRTRESVGMISSCSEVSQPRKKMDSAWSKVNRTGLGGRGRLGPKMNRRIALLRGVAKRLGVMSSHMVTIAE